MPPHDSQTQIRSFNSPDKDIKYWNLRITYVWKLNIQWNIIKMSYISL